MSICHVLTKKILPHQGFAAPDCHGYLLCIQLHVCHSRLSDQKRAELFNELAAFQPNSHQSRCGRGHNHRNRRVQGEKRLSVPLQKHTGGGQHALPIFCNHNTYYSRAASQYVTCIHAGRSRRVYMVLTLQVCVYSSSKSHPPSTSCSGGFSGFVHRL